MIVELTHGNQLRQFLTKLKTDEGGNRIRISLLLVHSENEILFDFVEISSENSLFIRTFF